MVVKFDADSYAECYPGTRAEEDVNVDSDDEPDFDKMDLVKCVLFFIFKGFAFVKIFCFIIRVIKKDQLVGGILIQMKNTALI